jgi:hypothetical protein
MQDSEKERENCFSEVTHKRCSYNTGIILTSGSNLQLLLRVITLDLALQSFLFHGHCANYYLWAPFFCTD